MRVVLPLIVAVLCLAWIIIRRYVLLPPRWSVGAMLALLIAGSFGANEVKWAQREAAYTSAVSSILNRDDGGAFACERVMRNFFSSHGYVGHVEFDAQGRPAKDAFLSMETCAQLQEFRKHPDQADRRQIIAVHTLAHEAAHLTGERGESAAECTALAHDAEVFAQLGATEQQALAYVQRYRREVIPRLPSEYTAPCPA